MDRVTREPPRRPDRQAQRRFRVPRSAPPEPGAGAVPPNRGVMGPYRARVPGSHKCRISQWLREKRAGSSPAGADFPTGQPAGARDSAVFGAHGNLPETPSETVDKIWRKVGDEAPKQTDPRVAITAAKESLTPPASRPCGARQQ
jgi:hypothetical protein